MKKGILLINLGTPSAPDTAAVRRYLREFLLDPRVIDISAWARYLLVYGLILPFRPKSSAAAYQKIWTDAGSPLLVYGQQLVEALSQELGEDFVVSLGMRYGEPSIAMAWEALAKQGCEQVTVLPLFPQYASAATGSALEDCLKVLSRQQNIPSVRVIHEFYQDAGFIQAYKVVMQTALQQQSVDHVLFSYHGLPTRQIQKAGCQHACDTAACPAISEANQFCYRAQCYATTRSLAETLSLAESQYSTAFQSRLGRTPWIQPYTDEVLPALAAKGVKKLAVVCPSFVADCLETLEEIGIRAREQWLQLGGEELVLVPCLNAHEQWVKALANLLRKRND